MCQNVYVVMFVVSAVRPVTVQADEGPAVQKRFSQCVLFQAKDGQVWLGEPLVALGMIGVAAAPPLYRLSPAVAEAFRPLVNELQEPHDEPAFWIWGLPQVKNADDPLVLVQVQCVAEPRQVSTGTRAGHRAERREGEPAREYEIPSLDLLRGEFITAGWREAWNGLDRGLKEIVAASRLAPSSAKRERLAVAIEQSSRCLNVMSTCRVEAASRDPVSRLAPKARLVRTTQLKVERQWGGQLREYVAILQIAPQTPLPPDLKRCPKVEILAASPSPADFMQQIRRDWPADTLDEPLMYVQGLDRVVDVWEIEGAGIAAFEAWRAQAKEQLDRTKLEQQQHATSSSPQESVAVPPWGAVLHKADAKLLAEKGILQGIVVERIASDAPDVGLRAGDVILNYGSVVELTMAQYYPPLARLTAVVRFGGKLEVLRGHQILTIAIPPNATASPSQSGGPGQVR